VSLWLPFWFGPAAKGKSNFGFYFSHSWKVAHDLGAAGIQKSAVDNPRLWPTAAGISVCQRGREIIKIKIVAVF
jgi:hypothetical protein